MFEGDTPREADAADSTLNDKTQKAMKAEKNEHNKAPSRKRVSVIPASKSEEPVNLDPVKVYLREMGAASLLSVKEEVEIAKRIEQGEKQIQNALFSLPIALSFLKELALKLRAGETSITTILRGYVDTDPALSELKERFIWQVG
ncbi:MAG: hypothetical protein KAR13_02630, partial [Desulfobulbaceae bacterium]|nr:hypothetical protein [Desulfobulbaceae bacterium]